jgi:hypothetical protein
VDYSTHYIHSVYEATALKSHDHVAVKILNPLGYKLASPSLLSRCVVLQQGSYLGAIEDLSLS